MSLELLTAVVLRLPPEPGSHPDMPERHLPIHSFSAILPQVERTEEALAEVWAEVLEFLRADLTSGVRHDFYLKHGIEVVESSLLQAADHSPLLGRWVKPLSVDYIRGERWGRAPMGVFADATQHCAWRPR